MEDLFPCYEIIVEMVTVVKTNIIVMEYKCNRFTNCWKNKDYIFTVGEETFNDIYANLQQGIYFAEVV